MCVVKMFVGAKKAHGEFFQAIGARLNSSSAFWLANKQQRRPTQHVTEASVHLRCFW